MKLSVAIVARNEERHIAGCLRSVAFADEIVLLNGESTDKTVEVAKQLGAKVTTIKNDPLMKRMMNQAFDKCKGDWILNVDADERVTPELANEILARIADPAGNVAFYFPRKNIIFGKWIAHSFWYPDKQLRLFKRGAAKYPGKNVHEQLVVNGPVSDLASGLEHINYESVSEFVLRLDRYTKAEADKIIKSGRKITWRDAIWFPVSEFLLRFFHEKGYLDGLHGLVLSLLQAFYWEVIFAKVWESEGFWQYGDAKFLNEVMTEGKRVARDFRYWEADSSTSRAQKVILKVRNKLLN